MRTKRIRRISVVLVPILVAMTVAPVSAASAPQGTWATGWFDSISQWVEYLYSGVAGFGSADTGFASQLGTASVATAASTTEVSFAGESGSNVVGESGSNFAGESGSNLAGESGSNLTLYR